MSAGCETNPQTVRRKSGSLASLREGNRKRVIDALRERGVASRADLARITGLSRSTVSTIVADLVDTGLAGERDGEPSEGRRRGAAAGDGLPQPVRGPRGRASTSATATCASRSPTSPTRCSPRPGASSTSTTRPTTGWPRPPSSSSRCWPRRGPTARGCSGSAWASPRRSTAPPAPSRARRSCPGGSGSTPPPRPPRGSGSRSRSRTTPTSARSRSSPGARRGASSEVAYIKVSTGIGAGLISGGRLQHGVGGTAGEIGHTVIADGGPVCRCGNRGCLETLASTRSIAELLSASRAEEVSSRRVLELSAAGDAAAQRLIGDAGRAIGIAVANLCNLLNPQCVIVGGDLGAAGDVAARSVARHGAAQRDPQRGRGPRDRRRRARGAGGAARRPRAGDARVRPVRRPRVDARRRHETCDGNSVPHSGRQREETK